MINREREKEIKELAKLLNVAPELIIKSLQMLKSGTAYDVWLRPKRPGSKETRQIQAAQPPLNGIQAKIAQTIYPWSVSEINHSYIKGRRHPTALIPHLNSNAFYSFDIKDAFNSVKRQLVRLSFLRLGHEFQRIKIDFTQELADLIADLICYSPTGKTEDAFLPQGHAASPYVFNLAFRDIDRTLADFARKKGYQITRFSDNLLLSAKETIPLMDRTIAIRLIKNWGPFKIPEEKTIYREVKQGQDFRFDFLGLTIVASKEGQRWIEVQEEKLGEYRFAILEAIDDRAFSESRFHSLRGRINYLKTIYRDRPFPSEVAEPWQKYCSMRDEQFQNRLVK